MNVELLLSVGGLALLDTLSPATIGVTLYLLLNETKRLPSRIMVYLLTVAGLYFLVGVMLMMGLEVLLQAFSVLLQSKIVSWGIFSVGVILFVVSFLVPKQSKNGPPKPKSKSLLSMIALGFTTTLIEVGTAFPYFAAIALMTTSGLAAYEWMPMMAGYNFIMILPPLLIFIIYLVLGRMIRRPLERLQAKIAKQSGTVLSWVLCIAGLILIINTVDYL